MKKIIIMFILLLFITGCKDKVDISKETDNVDSEIEMNIEKMPISKVEENEQNEEQIEPTIYEYIEVVSDYVSEDENDDSDQDNTKQIDEIHNMDILDFDIPGDNVFVPLSISFNQLKNNADSNKEYRYAAEKDANIVYMFYDHNKMSSVDKYRIDYMTPYSEKKYSLILEDSYALDFVIEDMLTAVNSIVFFYYTNDGKYMMKITDRELVPIQEFVIPEGIKMNRMEVVYDENSYQYLLEVDYNNESKKVLLPMDYSGYTGRHIVDQFRSTPILNGQKYNNESYYDSSNYEMTKNVSNGVLITSSNKGAVLTIRDIPEKNSHRHLFVNDYFIISSKEGRPIYVEKYNEPVSEDHGIYNLLIYESNIRADQNGNIYYIEKDTLDLVRTDNEFYEISRITIENEDIKGCITKEFYNDFWTVKDGYLLIDNEEWFYYMNLENNQMGKIALDNNYVEYWNYNAVVYDNGNTIFDTDSKRFVNSYSSFERYGLYNQESYFEYEGVAYYEDDPNIHYESTGIIEDRDDILPESMAPQFFYKGELVRVRNSQSFNGVSYYHLLDQGWVGTINGNKFEPLIMEDVRDFIITKYGIIYTGKDDRSNLITLQSKGVKVQCVEDLPVDSIAVSGQWLYYVIDNKTMKRKSILEMTASGDKQFIGEKVNDLALLAGETSADTYNVKYNFKLEGNDNYVVAYDVSNYKTLVFDENSQCIEVLNTSFIHLGEEDQIYVEVFTFFTRHDIKSGEDSILGEYYFVSKDMAFKNYIISCTPYEGPSRTNAIDMTADAINPFKQYNNYSEDVDYSIEIGNGHQALIIVYDHKLKKLSLEDILWGIPEYEVTDDGLKYWIESNNYKDGGFIPLRKGSKVQVYWTKRT